MTKDLAMLAYGEKECEGKYLYTEQFIQAVGDELKKYYEITE